MIRWVRALVGMALGVVAVVAPAWGLFHIVRQGSCGDVGQAACPSDMAGWIVAIVLSATVVGPLACLIAGRDRFGTPWLIGPLSLLFFFGLFAGAAVSFLGASSADGTHWVGIVIAGIGGLLLFATVRGIIRGRKLMAASASSGAPPPPSRDVTSRADMAALANQLQQVAQAQAASKPKPASSAAATPAPAPPPRPPAAPEDALAGRLRRLSELRESGLISAEEHAARRQEILDEI